MVDQAELQEKELLALVRRMYLGDGFGGIEELFDDQIVVTDWMAPGVEYRGRDEVIEKALTPGVEAFPDARHEEIYALADGDKVVFCARMHATFAKDYKGVRAHGQAVSWPFIDTLQFRDGKIVRWWFGSDTMAAAREMRAIPEGIAPW